MKKGNKVDERAKKIDEAIKLVWWSLDSHLDWTHYSSKKYNKRWEKKCVKDYARIIKILTELY